MSGVDEREMKPVDVDKGSSEVEVTEQEKEDHHDEPPPFVDQLKAILIGSKINILYVFIPITFVAQYLGAPGSLQFVTSFLSLIPLAAVLGDLTEDLAAHTNDAIGALINVTFGNVTEVIVSIQALRLKQYDLIIYTMVGSVIGNMLLVLGSSLLMAGWKKPVMNFNGDAAKTYIGMLLLGAFALIIPTTFGSLSPESDNPSAVRNVSNHMSLFICFAYALFLYFQLRTHKTMFDGDDDDEDEGPQFSFAFGLVMIGAVALLIAQLSDVLVATVEDAAKAYHLSRHFIGLVVIAIVGNVAEHASAIIMAMKGKYDIALGVALGSSIQIEMFALPFVVVVSWVFGYELSLNITPFLGATLFASIVVTYACLYDSGATWLQGAKMLTCYVLLCIAFLDAPDPAEIPAVVPN